MSANQDRRASLVGVLFMVGLDIACVRRVPHFGEFETTCETWGCASETAEEVSEASTAASTSGISTSGGDSDYTCDSDCSMGECDGRCTTGDACPEGCCRELSACVVEEAADKCEELCDCPRYVFASKESFTGNMGGVEGADLLCGALVDALYGPDSAYCERRRFRALLSIDELRTAADFGGEGFSGAYILPNGVTVAKGWPRLRETLQAPINVAEDGSTVDGAAWTGVARGYHCNKWMSDKNTAEGSAGDVSRTDVLLHDDESKNWCDQALQLLCVEVPRHLASDRP